VGSFLSRGGGAVMPILAWIESIAVFANFTRLASENFGSEKGQKPCKIFGTKQDVEQLFVRKPILKWPF
jgi:hypothetical protein